MSSVSPVQFTGGPALIQPQLVLPRLVVQELWSGMYQARRVVVLWVLRTATPHPERPES